VAQNTIHVEEIYTQLTPKKVRNESKDLRFLFVGVIFAKKRLDTAIKAFGKLASKGFRFKFDVVGNGEIIEDLKTLAESEGIASNVEFHGPKYADELTLLFKNADVFILPGTGGLAINEAMAYSLPVITTPGDGTAYDLVYKDRNGFILDFDYPQEVLENSIAHFFNISKEELAQMGAESLNIIKEKATLRNMVTQIIRSLES
jgi:glycosyltransferase involved in cell wall biosynthesis